MPPRINLQTGSQRPFQLFAVMLIVMLGLAIITPRSQAIFRSTPTPDNKSAEAVAKRAGESSVPGEILVRFRGDAAAARATIKSGSYTETRPDETGRAIEIKVERLSEGPEIVEGLRVARVEANDTDRAIKA